jgi:hypothetical protein
VVHELPSSQGVPFVTGVDPQAPVAGLQLSAVQALPSLHTTAVPPHVPFVHWSPVVQRLASLQAVPFATGVLRHPPVAGLQLSAVQALPSLHTTAVPPHVPFVHWSPVVQRLASSHGVPFATGELRHPPVAGLQLSAVQAFPSLHTTAVPPHVPFVH